MTEIKFRAWNPYTKSMYFYDVDTLSCMPSQCKPFLMQFTGLKDKNGKEIYEGDVVIWQDTSSNYPNIIHKKEVVQWGNIGWDGVSLIYKIEVIGNIHENRELVKP